MNEPEQKLADKFLNKALETTDASKMKDYMMLYGQILTASKIRVDTEREGKFADAQINAMASAPAA